MELTGTTVIAVYGAAVSTITALWNIRNSLRDRAHVRLSVMLAQRIGDPSAKKHLMLTMVNVGRRPVTIGKWGGTYRRPKNGHPYFFVAARGLPKELKESEQHHELTDDFQGLADNGIKETWAYDTAGQKWTVPKIETKRVETEIKALGQQSDKRAEEIEGRLRDIVSQPGTLSEE